MQARHLYKRTDKMHLRGARVSSAHALTCAATPPTTSRRSSPLPFLSLRIQILARAGPHPHSQPRNRTHTKLQSVTMRRITKLGLTLGVLAAASFLAPGKSKRLSPSEAKRLVGVWGGLPSSLLLPSSLYMCALGHAPRPCTHPQAAGGHHLACCPRFVWVCERGPVSLNLPSFPMCRRQDP